MALAGIDQRSSCPQGRRAYKRRHRRPRQLREERMWMNRVGGLGCKMRWLRLRLAGDGDGRGVWTHLLRRDDLLAGASAQAGVG